MPSGWRLKVLRGPYRSAVPLALSNGQTPPSLSTEVSAVDYACIAGLVLAWVLSITCQEARRFAGRATNTKDGSYRPESNMLACMDKR